MRPWRGAFAACRSLPVLLLLAVSLASSCARGRVAFQHTFESPEALAAAVLDGVARKDRSFLESLALSEDEFRYLVWPELPAARPERNMPWDYVWKDLRQKSRAGLTETLVQHGGRRYQLAGVSFAGETTRHATYDVSRATQLRVNTEDGEMQTIRLFGSVLASKGRYKVFSFVVD